MDERQYQQLVEATALALSTLAVATARCTNDPLLATVIEGIGGSMAKRRQNEVLVKFVEAMTTSVRALGPIRPSDVS